MTESHPPRTTPTGRTPQAVPTADAAPLPLPVTAATLLEDRAELTRTALLGALPPGVHRLRLGPVTPLTVDRSLRGELSVVPVAARDGREPGRVLELRVVRRWSAEPPASAVGGPAADAPEVERRVHELSEQLRVAELDLARNESRAAVLDQLLPELRREITEGAGAGETRPEAWAERLDRAEAAQDAQAEAVRAARFRLTKLKQKLIEAQVAWEQAEDRPMVLTAHLEATIEIGGGTPPPADTAVELTVHHLVPCALWRPAYRATLDEGDTGRLQLERDAFLWQRTGEPWTDVTVTLSTARPARAAAPPHLPQDLLTLRDRSAEERRTIEVDLREVEIPDLGPEGPDSPESMGEGAGPVPAVLSTLPGVDDGGEARRLVVAQPVTLPSDGRAHRVPLGRSESAATLELSCAPELSPLVFRTARFRNTSGQVLLSGPVDLVRGSGFVGRGELRFTAADAPAELCFGSEDTFRVVRTVTEARGSGTLTGALTGRSVRSREVGVSLSRFAPPGAGEARVVLRERIPVSEVAAVEVRVDKERTAPPPDAVDADGIVRWELTLAPDERRSLLLRYDLVAARSVAMPD
ncbi:mucoidy inhibitor MuiA family protein [Streptacidiphilus rugosus]|uniref:mucoidy inhibitor MuiA family protein n=1 Tax=Streptacidiphilus rugosus TaxID=405783 RepID=UPI000691B5DA|nr:mucoidy inhibitor MuiA family protein [Streptacidiphilus rugosus]